MQTETKLQNSLDFNNERDYDLIGYMSLQNEDMQGAELAWQEFYKRHFGYLFGLLKDKYSGLFDELSIEDFATESLNKAFDKAESFNEYENLTKKEQHWHVRSWLGTIAENLLISEFRKQKGLQLIFPEEEQEWDKISFDLSLRKEAENSTKKDGMRERQLSWIIEAFETLTDREEYILRVTAEYERPDRQHQRLPNKVSKELAEALNTTTENVRQMRKRANDKVKEYVQRKESEFERNKHDKQKEG